MPERVIPSAAATFADLEGPLDVAPVDRSDLDGALEERDVLGKGGLGEVVECFDRDLRRVVALKRPLRDGPAASDALLREAQITAQLVHPSVPSVHAIGFGEDGRPWFTMTRLRGRTLHELLSEPLEWPLARRLRLVLSIAQALTYAHHRGVLHRDLKPENVFVGPFGEISVVDWGIAKVLGESEADQQAVETTIAGKTAAGVFAGTPAYAAPEQLRGETDLDARVDVYALGALLHAVIVGRPPVEGDSADSVRERVLAGDIPVPGTDEGVPPAISAVLARALATDRAERYPTVAEFSADLEAFLDHRPVRAYEESGLAALTRWYQQDRPLKRWDVDLFIFTGACLGGFLTSLMIHFRPALAPWLAGLAALGYATIGAYAIVRVARLWHMGKTSRLFDVRLLFAYVILVASLAVGLTLAFGGWG